MAHPSIQKQLLPLKSNAYDRLETFQLLICGILPFGKDFATCVALHKDEQFRRRVIVTDSLPLKDSESSATKAAIDFVCFVVSMQSRLSLDKVRESLDHIVPAEQGHFIMGRWALVVLDSSDASKFVFSIEDIISFSKSKELPIVYGGSLQDAQAMDFLAGRVATMLKRSAREGGISPLYASAIRPES
jgi:hypothetical protein